MKTTCRKCRKTNIITSITSVFFLLSFCYSTLGSNIPYADASSVQKKQSASDVPVIYPRSSWTSAAYEKRTKKIWPAEYESPKVMIIHHTATNYKSSTSKQIKKIYKYHSYTRKWGDIGYNYIIGKDGAIFEGRYGGNGVIGGHSYYNGTNYNKGSIGIAVLGNYENDKLTAESTASLEKLLGWLAANNDIKISSDTKFFKKDLNSSAVGHRNVASTACPGKNIYSNLAAIRTNGESLANTYENYAYKTSGDGTSYEIRGGKKYSGSAKQPVIEISNTQLAAYASDGEVENNSSSENYPSGTLFKVTSSGQNGILENGSIRPIASSAVLSANYNSANFVEISQEEWESYSASSAAGFRSGAFLKDSSGNYYIISENKKRLLSLEEAQMIRIDYSRSHEVSDSELSAYASGENITSAKDLPVGTIITTGNRNYFYIQSGAVKQEISKAVYSASFSPSMIIKVSAKFARQYKTRGSLSFQNGSVVSYRKNYYFIENGKKRMFKTKSLANSMGFRSPVKAKRKEMGGIGDGQVIE